MTADERAFVFENHATFTVWVAGIGPPTYNAKPEITGFELAPGKWNVVGLPANLESIRFWPRTGCRYVEDTISLMGKNVNITKFRCVFALQNRYVLRGGHVEVSDSKVDRTTYNWRVRRLLL